MTPVQLRLESRLFFDDHTVFRSVPGVRVYENMGALCYDSPGTILRDQNILLFGDDSRILFSVSDITDRLSVNLERSSPVSVRADSIPDCYMKKAAKKNLLVPFSLGYGVNRSLSLDFTVEKDGYIPLVQLYRSETASVGLTTPSKGVASIDDDLRALETYAQSNPDFRFPIPLQELPAYEADMRQRMKRVVGQSFTNAMTTLSMLQWEALARYLLPRTAAPFMSFPTRGVNRKAHYSPYPKDSEMLFTPGSSPLRSNVDKIVLYQAFSAEPLDEQTVGALCTVFSGHERQSSYTFVPMAVGQ